MCFTAMLEQWVKMDPSPTWDKVGHSIKKIMPLKVESDTSRCIKLLESQISCTHYYMWAYHKVILLFLVLYIA